MKKVLLITVLAVIMVVSTLSLVPKAEAVDADPVQLVVAPIDYSWIWIFLNYINNTEPDFRVQHVKACWTPNLGYGGKYARIDITADIDNIGGNKGLNLATGTNMMNWISFFNNSYGTHETLKIERKAPYWGNTVQITSKYVVYNDGRSFGVGAYANVGSYAYPYGIPEYGTWPNNRLNNYSVINFNPADRFKTYCLEDWN